MMCHLKNVNASCTTGWKPCASPNTPEAPNTKKI